MQNVSQTGAGVSPSPAPTEDTPMPYTFKDMEDLRGTVQKMKDDADKRAGMESRAQRERLYAKGERWALTTVLDFLEGFIDQHGNLPTAAAEPVPDDEPYYLKDVPSSPPEEDDEDGHESNGAEMVIAQATSESPLLWYLNRRGSYATVREVRGTLSDCIMEMGEEGWLPICISDANRLVVFYRGG